MPPRRAPCQICNSNESKYTCASCSLLYCSVSCYKQHKEVFCPKDGVTPMSDFRESIPDVSNVSPSLSTSRPGVHPTERALEDSKPFRPLSSLNWPYVPEQSAYPDPLKRDDPKPLQLHQYETIATSPVIRNILAKNPRLITLLTSLDSLQGVGREDALQRALGVHGSQTGAHQHQKSAESDEDVLALRTLTEAIEAAVRGEKEGTLDLDWGE